VSHAACCTSHLAPCTSLFAGCSVWSRTEGSGFAVPAVSLRRLSCFCSPPITPELVCARHSQLVDTLLLLWTNLNRCAARRCTIFTLP
jgi:hypothetical protein